MAGSQIGSAEALQQDNFGVLERWVHARKHPLCLQEPESYPGEGRNDRSCLFNYKFMNPNEDIQGFEDQDEGNDPLKF